MTTLLLIFCIAFALSVGLAPLARALGLKLGALDQPGKGKSICRSCPGSAA